MKIKSVIPIIILLLNFSCTTNKSEVANKMLEEFHMKKNIDKRETIFNIQVNKENGIIVLQGETDNPKLKQELLKVFETIDFKDKITLLPDSTIGDKTFGLINISVANLRSQAKHSAELATQALLGTPVKILKIENNWLLVQTPDKYISWIDSDGVFPTTKAGFTEWKNSKRIIFKGENEIVYTDINQENAVSDITMGNILELVELHGNFARVKFPDGRTGYTELSDWIDFNDFKTNTASDSAGLIKLAKQFTGRPYLWGGTSARAMDCSGFVKTIYFMNGIILARDASLQYRHGQIINNENHFENFLPGDLLFFGQGKTDTRPEKITHVALSLGKTQFIHAAGKVQINSFDPQSIIYSEYRKNSFVGAKRIIGSENSEGIQLIKNHPWY